MTNRHFQDWLYEDGEDASKGVYVAKMDEIRAMAGPVTQRHFEKIEAERRAVQERVDAEVHLREQVMEAIQAQGEGLSWSSIPCEGTKVSLEIAMILKAFPAKQDAAAEALEPDPPPIAAAA